MDNSIIEKRALRKDNIKKSIKEWIICIAIALFIAIVINKFIVYKVKIPTGSMIPTLNVNDQLFVTRIYDYDKIERGDILVFYSKEFKDTFIKRVIGLPGDEVKIDKGVVSVNGEVLKEDYVKNPDVKFSQTYNITKTYNVPEGKYFFLGDNRPVSKDSRLWKNPFIDEKDIEAKAQLKVYPFSDFGLIE